MNPMIIVELHYRYIVAVFWVFIEVKHKIVWLVHVYKSDGWDYVSNKLDKHTSLRVGEIKY